jgi:exonuclease VII large subunit
MELLTVSELTYLIRGILQANFYDIFVEGEISNFVHHPLLI